MSVRTDGIGTENRLSVRMRLTSASDEGAVRTQGVVTIDVSSTGACVVADEVLPVGTVVDLAARRFFFETRAAVRSIYRDRQTGVTVLGLEFLDRTWEPFA